MDKLFISGYNNVTFTDVWSDSENFKNDVQSSAIPVTVTDDNLDLLFYLLYAKYGNSHIVNSDINQFKYRVFMTIYTHGPIWQRQKRIQEDLQNMTDDDLRLGGKAIYNKAFNPDTYPSTGSLEEIPGISEQNVTSYKKTKAEGYAILLSLLDANVTERFLDQFKKLFIRVAAPSRQSLFITEEQDDE